MSTFFMAVRALFAMPLLCSCVLLHYASVLLGTLGLFLATGWPLASEYLHDNW